MLRLISLKRLTFRRWLKIVYLPIKKQTARLPEIQARSGHRIDKLIERADRSSVRQIRHRPIFVSRRLQEERRTPKNNNNNNNCTVEEKSRGESRRLIRSRLFPINELYLLTRRVRRSRSCGFCGTRKIPLDRAACVSVRAAHKYAQARSMYSEERRQEQRQQHRESSPRLRQRRMMDRRH